MTSSDVAVKTVLDDLYRTARDAAIANTAELLPPNNVLAYVALIRRALLCLAVVEAAGSNLVDPQVAPVLLAGVYTRMHNDPEMWH